MYTELELHQTFMVEGQILNYCGPLFFSCSHELRPENVKRNGSFGLIDTGQKRLLVTCHHVIDEFRKLRDAGQVKEMAILLGVGYPTRLAESQLIDSDERLDLATFDMETLLPHCPKKNFYPICSSPAPQLRPKDILAIIGYVGAGRANSTAGADFQYEAFGLSVADVDGIRVIADLSKTKTERNSDAAANNSSTRRILRRREW